MPRVLPVSVVIPTRDRPELLHDLIDSICAGECLPAEIVVADQGSRVTLPEHRDGVRIRHVLVPSVGLSRNRNAGIDAATNDVLVFTDDDSIVDRGWLGELCGALAAAPARTVVTGAVLPGGVEGVTPSLTSETERVVFTGRRATGGDPLFPNNMAVPREAFEEIGLFDVRLGAGAGWFPAAEDNDFGFRLLEHGYAIEFVPSAVIRHVGARSGRELRALEWAYGRGQGAFYAKHMRFSDMHMVRRLASNVAERVVRLSGIVRGDLSAAREGIYLAGLLVGAGAWRLRYPRLLEQLLRTRGR